MDYNVGTVIEGVLNVWAQEGVVHHDHDPMAVGDGGHGANVDETQGRVARALNPDELSLVRPNQLGDVEFDARRESHLDAVGGGHLGEVAVRAAVDVRDGYHVRSRSKRLQDRRRRCRARREGQGVSCMLESGDGPFEVVPRHNRVSSATRTAPCSPSLSRQWQPYLFGFELREYSYSPTGRPTAVWAKVVDREI